jgi:hypothetical protein
VVIHYRFQLTTHNQTPGNKPALRIVKVILAAVASETLTLSSTNQPFLGEAIVLLALEGTNSQQTDIFDFQPTEIRIAEELVSNPLPVPLSREYADHSQDKVLDEQESATDEAFTTLAADDLAMGRLALNISW